MFRTETTFIIGAGASKEFSLPTGIELKDKIASAVRFRFEVPFSRQIGGDDQLLQVLRQKYELAEVNEFTAGGNRLSESMSIFPSIDEALHYHSSDEKTVLLGKLSIAKIVLESENKSWLHNRHDPENAIYLSSEDNWLTQFLSIATSGIKKEETNEIFSKVRFINFNYDRTLEHFLYWSLQARAGLSDDAAREAMGELSVVRPYGSLGPLDWQETGGMPFGGNRNLFELAEKIRTYTERSQYDLVAQIDRLINQSKLVIIIGFGFHEQNLSLFDPIGGKRHENRDVWATVSGIHDENHQLIRDSLKRRISKRNMPRLFPWKANEFFSQLRPSIAAAVG